MLCQAEATERGSVTSSLRVGLQTSVTCCCPPFDVIGGVLYEWCAWSCGPEKLYPAYGPGWRTDFLCLTLLMHPGTMHSNQR